MSSNSLNVTEFLFEQDFWQRQSFKAAYFWSKAVNEDVLSVVKAFPSICPRMARIPAHDRVGEKLLCLDLVLTLIQTRHDIPISVWIPSEYPSTPPIALLSSQSPSFPFPVPNQFFSQRGQFVHQMMYNWHKKKTSLVDFLQVMASCVAQISSNGSAIWQPPAMRIGFTEVAFQPQIVMLPHHGGPPVQHGYFPPQPLYASQPQTGGFQQVYGTGMYTPQPFEVSYNQWQQNPPSANVPMNQHWQQSQQPHYVVQPSAIPVPGAPALVQDAPVANFSMIAVPPSYDESLSFNSEEPSRPAPSEKQMLMQNSQTNLVSYSAASSSSVSVNPSVNQIPRSASYQSSHAEANTMSSSLVSQPVPSAPPAAVLEDEEEELVLAS